jgi:Domain of unknown function (DUF3854)
MSQIAQDDKDLTVHFPCNSYPLKVTSMGKVTLKGSPIQKALLEIKGKPPKKDDGRWDIEATREATQFAVDLNYFDDPTPEWQARLDEEYGCEDDGDGPEMSLFYFPNPDGTTGQEWINTNPYRTPEEIEKWRAFLEGAFQKGVTSRQLPGTHHASLCDHHWGEIVEKSGVSAYTVKEICDRGFIYTIQGKLRIRNRLNLSGAKYESGLVMHGIDPDAGIPHPDHISFKPDNRGTRKNKDTGKEEDGPKYCQPRESKHGALIIPLTNGKIWEPTALKAAINGPSVPVFITEGYKKGLVAGMTFNGIVIALNGVWTECVKGTLDLRPELEAINWEGRKVYVCFDSDKYTNSKVMDAEKRLGQVMTEAGAEVLIVNLPTGEGKGLDDQWVALPSDKRSSFFKGLLRVAVEFTPILKSGETIEEATLRHLDSTGEGTSNLAYSDGQWYKPRTPRNYQSMPDHDGIVEKQIVDTLIALKMRKDVSDKGQPAKYKLVGAKAFKDSNLRSCLNLLKVKKGTTFPYDADHLTFADGQVMELKTGQIIDGSNLTFTIHALPFTYQPTEFENLPSPVQNLLSDRFLKEDLPLVRAVLRYALDRADDSHRKGYTVQLLGESNSGKSVLMDAIALCKPLLTAKKDNFDMQGDRFYLSTTLGKGQDVLTVDDVKVLPNAQAFYSLVSQKDKEMEFKNAKHNKEISRNVFVIFGGTEVVTPSTSHSKTGYETRYIPLKLQPLPSDKEAHREAIFKPYMAAKTAHAYALANWALSMSRDAMMVVLDKAANDPSKKAMLSEETQVGRFSKACLSLMPTEYTLNGESLSLEGLGRKLLADPQNRLTDGERVNIERAIQEQGIHESALYDAYKMWAKEEGISSSRGLTKKVFLESFLELHKERHTTPKKGAKERSGNAEARIRTSYGGLWWAGEDPLYIFGDNQGLGDRLIIIDDFGEPKINLDMLNPV